MRGRFSTEFFQPWKVRIPLLFEKIDEINISKLVLDISAVHTAHSKKNNESAHSVKLDIISKNFESINLATDAHEIAQFPSYLSIQKHHIRKYQRELSASGREKSITLFFNIKESGRESQSLATKNIIGHFLIVVSTAKIDRNSAHVSKGH